MNLCFAAICTMQIQVNFDLIHVCEIPKAGKLFNIKCYLKSICTESQSKNLSDGISYCMMNMPFYHKEIS